MTINDNRAVNGLNVAALFFCFISGAVLNGK